MQLPVVAIQPQIVKLPDGTTLQCENVCKVYVEFANAVVHRVTFAVVDMELSFVLGMQFLTQKNCYLDFGTGELSLRDSEGRVQSKLQTSKQPTCQKVSNCTLSALQNFSEFSSVAAGRSSSVANVFAISAKQAQRLLRRADLNVFSVLAKEREIGLTANEIATTCKFVEENYKDCDELVNNTVRLCQEVPRLTLNPVRNTLLVDSSEAREVYPRMYQRTDLYQAGLTNLNRAQILACNCIVTTTLEQVASLINLPLTLFCCNIFVVPKNLVAPVTKLVEDQAWCVGNIVLTQGEDWEKEGEKLLQPVLKELLTVGSPVEYILSLQASHDGLPVGATRHLLDIEDPEVRQEFREILKQYADVCPATLPFRVPPVRGVDDVHEIRLQNGAKPVSLMPYRQGPAHAQLIDTQVKELLEAGCIRPSKSPYASPVLIIKKPDGSVRFCVDYRQLNKITVRDKFPLPRTDDLVNALAGSCVFTSLDLRSGYWQLRMQEESVEKTAFVTQTGQWEWTVMPFGLTNAPSSFQRVMQRILGDLVYVKVYLDDIIIHSRTMEEHLKHLRVVLDRLREYQFYLKIRKCKFLQHRVTFLGHEVDSDGVHIAKEKVLAVQHWPAPTNVSEVRGFLGFVQFFHHALQDLAKESLPLTQLTCKDVPWEWGPAQHRAFTKLKEMVTNAPCLALVDLSDPHVKLQVHTDASSTALGGVLLAYIADQWRPVSFYSRKFNPTECNYSTTDREMLGVVDSLRHFRHFLLGREFTVCTDHKPLVYFFGKNAPLSPRQARWQALLSEYQPGMQLLHVPGKENVLADGLSRRPDYQELERTIPLSQEQSNVPTQVDSLVTDCYESLSRGRPVTEVRCPKCRDVLPPDTLLYPGRQEKERELRCGSCGHAFRFCGFNSPLGRYSPVVRTIDGATGVFLTVKGEAPSRVVFSSVQALGSGLQLDALGLSSPTLDLAQELQPLQEADSELAPLRELAEGADPGYRLRDGILYKVLDQGDRVVVPRSLENQLISEYHDHTGHLGVSRTLDRLKSRFWFPAMKKKVVRYIKECDTCQRTKVDNSKPRGLLKPIAMSSEPWRDIAMDFLTELPTCDSHSTLLVVVDRFSKMLRLVPLGLRTEAPDVAEAYFQHVAKIHGIPDTIITDRDPRFQSDFWKNLFERHLGTQLKFSTAYHPQTDGQSERSIRSILQLLRGFVHEHPTDWPSFLAQVELYYNATKQASTGKSPHEIVFGWHLQLPVDLIAPLDPVVRKFVDIWAEAKTSIEKAQEAQKRYADTKRSDEVFHIGDFVLLSTRNIPLKTVGSRKLRPLWIGPYRIETVLGDNAYRLVLPSALHRVHPVFNVSQLKRYHGTIIAPPDPVEIEGQEEYEVASILRHRRTGRRKRLEYLVSFVGYDSSANEWLPESNLANAPDVLAAYKQVHGL